MLIKLRCDRQNLIQLLGETGAAILDAVLALEFALTLGRSCRSSTTSANGRLPNSIRNLIAFPQRYSQAVVHLLSRANTETGVFHRGRDKPKSLSHVCVNNVFEMTSTMSARCLTSSIVFGCGRGICKGSGVCMVRNFSLCLNSFYRRSDAGVAA